MSRKRAYTELSESDFIGYIERLKIRLESIESTVKLAEQIELFSGSVRLAGVFILMDEKDSYTVLEFDYPGELSKGGAGLFRYIWGFLQELGVVHGGLKKIPKKAEKESEEKPASSLTKEQRITSEIKNLTDGEKELVGLIYWGEYSRKGGELAHKFGSSYRKTLTKLYK